MEEFEFNGKFIIKVIKNLEYHVYCDYGSSKVFCRYPIYYFKKRTSKCTLEQFKEYCYKKITEPQTPKTSKPKAPKKKKPQRCVKIFQDDKTYIFFPYYTWILPMLGYDFYEYDRMLHFGYIGNECYCFESGYVIDYENTIIGIIVNGDFYEDLPEYQDKENFENENDVVNFRKEYTNEILDTLAKHGFDFDRTRLEKMSFV